MRIQHNVTALNAYRNLRGNNLNLAKNLEKLSSGYKINRAGDDAAGLAVSEKMRAQITGLEAATKNAQDGISLVQTAEGALTEVHSMLNRMVTLATQSANGTYDNEVDRANLQKEVASLKSEINRISESSNYNGIKLLDGSLADGAMKSSLPNVTVNGVTGADGGTAVDVIELKKADDYRFSGQFEIKSHMTGNKFTAAAANVGDTVKFKLKFNDKSGEERIIEMNFVQGDAAGKLDKTKSSVLLDGKILANNDMFFKDAAFNAAMTTENSFVFGAAKILGEIEEFSDLFDIETLKTGAAAGGGAADTEILGFKAKQEAGDKAEVVSFLTNKKATLGDPANITLSDTKLTLKSKKIDDSIVVHGAKMFGLATGKAGEEGIKRATIEVNGEKFLFVTSVDKDEADVVEAIEKSGIKKENIIYSNTPGTSGDSESMSDVDVKAMVKLINKTLGEKVAKVGTTATDIVFEGKNKAGDSEAGLSLQIGDTADKFNKMIVAIDSMSVSSLKIKDIDIGTAVGASKAIGKIREAINSVSSTRGDLGALQNRLEHTINNLGVMHENITEAESRIRDTDMAKEMMAYTKNNILVQSATAMLAQANQLPQSVLQLLQ